MAAAFRRDFDARLLLAQRRSRWRPRPAPWPSRHATRRDSPPINSASALKLPRKSRRFSARRCRQWSRRPRSSTARSSPRPTSTSAWRCSPSPTAAQIPAEEVERLRQQVLRNLIDETLEIQAAKAEKIDDQGIGHRQDRRARRRQREADPDQLAAYLEANGSSINIASPPDRGRDRLAAAPAREDRKRVSVGDDEVKAVLDKLNASKGTEEYRVGEIFLSATPATAGADDRQCQQDSRAAQAAAHPSPAMPANIRKLRRRPSAATSAGSARNSFPPPLAAALRQMGPGTISHPIQVPGGVSIIAVQDTRKILTRRSARRSPQPEAGLDHLPQGDHPRRRPSRSSPSSPRPRGASAAAAAPRRSRPNSTAKSCQQRPGQDARSSAGAAADDAADAGRAGDAAVRLARRRRPRAGDVRPRRGRSRARRATTTSTTSSTMSG